MHKGSKIGHHKLISCKGHGCRGSCLDQAGQGALLEAADALPLVDLGETCAQRLHGLLPNSLPIPAGSGTQCHAAAALVVGADTAGNKQEKLRLINFAESNAVSHQRHGLLRVSASRAEES